MERRIEGIIKKGVIKMVKILIADDSTEKIGAVTQLIKSKFADASVSYSLDISNTRAQLYDNYYDLLIFDLNMPNVIGEMPSMDNGISFIDEIKDTQKIKKPLEIVILSAFDESVSSFKKNAEHAGFVVLQYESSKFDWKNVIASKIEYLTACEMQRKYIPRPPKCDVFIQTAVQVETEAIQDVFPTSKRHQLPNDTTTYYHSTIGINDKKIDIVYAQQTDMGMTAAACLASRAIFEFEPKYIIMSGIAAGLDEDMNLGDVMIASDIWDYSMGKYEENAEKEIEFIPDSKHRQLDDKLLETIRTKLGDLQNSIQTDLADQGIKPQIHMVDYASGVAVIKSKEYVKEHVLSHARKTKALDMEAYAIYYSAAKSTCTEGIVIKSISDLANKDKDDSYQSIASKTSALCAKYLITDVLFKTPIGEINQENL